MTEIRRGLKQSSFARVYFTHMETLEELADERTRIELGSCGCRLQTSSAHGFIIPAGAITPALE